MRRNSIGTVCMVLVEPAMQKNPEVHGVGMLTPTGQYEPALHGVGVLTPTGQ